MTIEKNIIATLEREMEKRGVSYVGLSSETGIPRTTLHGYLKGTSHPRSDSLEELAEKLGISLAELVSGDEYPRTGISCLDQVLAELPALHPQIVPIARETVSMLQTLFHLSDTLYDLDRQISDTQTPEETYRYCLHELRDSPCCPPSYGILVKRRRGDGWSTAAVVAPFSNDRAAVLRLMDLCARLQLSPEHLLDVVQDFLTLQARSV